MKLLAIDLDGTLLNRENTISQTNIKAIKKAQEKGIEIAIATGRAHFNVQLLLKEAGISAWILGANGATIHDKGGNLLRETSISKNEAKEILEYFEEHDFYYEVFSDQVIYTPENGRDLLTIEMFRMKNTNPKTNLNDLQEAAERQYSQEKFEFVSSYEDILRKTNKYYNLLAFSFDNKKLNDAWEHFENRMDLTIVNSASHLFELMHPDASKGCAVKQLAKKLGIQKEEIMVIGDNYNDLPMFENAGVSIAMGNANKDIKSFATHTTLTNDKNGVAYILEKLVFT